MVPESRMSMCKISGKELSIPVQDVTGALLIEI